MSLNKQETQVVRGSLTSWILNFESVSDPKRKQRMRKKLEGAVDVALDNIRSSQKNALEYQKIGNHSLSHEWQLEAKKWRSVADEVLRVAELVDGNRKG